MANNTKTYRIEIQMDAAKQELDDTNKKLAELDASLDGMDRNSDAAKAIVAEMAKLVQQAEGAEGNISELGTALDALKPGTLPALRAQVEELEKALDQTVRGTAEFDAALLALGNAKGSLKEVEDAIDALDPKMKAAAFVDFANGVVGAFGVATVAAETFGLSSDTVAEYEKKLLGCIAVLDSFEQISRALNSETLSVVKSTLASAKAYLTAGEAATAGGKAARLALISTGIGILIVAVGVLVANWDRLTASVKGSEAFFTKVKAITSGLFDSAIASLKLFGQLSKDFFTGDLLALIADAKGAGKKLGDAYAKGYQESVLESNRKVIEGQIAAQDRLVEVLKARGVETYQLEEANLAAKLALQKRGTEDEKKQYLDLARDLDVLRANQAKKERDEVQALTQAKLSGAAAFEAARGRDAYKAQMAVEESKLAALKAAASPNLAAIEAQEDVITALILSKNKERADKRRALESATLQAALVRRTAQGGEEYQLALDQNALQERAAALHLKTLQEAAQVDGAAVVAAKAELFRVQAARAGLFYDEQKRAEKAAQDAIFELHEFQYQRLVRAQQKREAEEATRKAQVNAAGGRVAAQLAAEEAERIRIASIPPLSFTDNVLVRVFGVAPEQLELTKQRIAEAAQNISDLVGSIFAGQQAAADQRIADAQERVSELDRRYQEAARAAEQTAQQIDSAKGARRDFLLQKLEKERAAEARLATEKAKAAKEQEQAARAKAALEKQQQQISAASTAIEAVLLGIEAGKAIAKAAAAGKFGFDNVAYAVAATAALATGFIAVKNAAKLEDGGELVGPSHAQGGIRGTGRFNNIEVEGGEFVVNKAATARNRPLLQLINEAGRTRALPPPTGVFAEGGQLPGGSSMPAGSVVVQSADLAELVETNRQMLAHLQTVAGATSTTASFGPPVLAFGFEAELKRRQLAGEMDAAINTARL